MRSLHVRPASLLLPVCCDAGLPAAAAAAAASAARQPQAMSVTATTPAESSSQDSSPDSSSRRKRKTTSESPISEGVPATKEEDSARAAQYQDAPGYRPSFGPPLPKLFAPLLESASSRFFSSTILFRDKICPWLGQTFNEDLV